MLLRRRAVEVVNGSSGAEGVFGFQCYTAMVHQESRSSVVTVHAEEMERIERIERRP